jgi:hypothetical protein
MSAPEFQTGLITLFREVFEGIPKGADGTWFVQGKEGIFDVLKTVDAERASRQATPESSSIGAHVRHLCYYLSFLNISARGESADADWAGSWSKQSFTPSEWADLAVELHKEYDDALRYLESRPEFKNQDNLTYALAQLAHAAFHLGALRALIKL